MKYNEEPLWFKKSNYPSKWLSEDSKALCKKILDNHKKKEEEAKKPKPRKTRKRR